MLGDIIFFLVAGAIVFATYKFVFAKKAPQVVDTKVQFPLVLKNLEK